MANAANTRNVRNSKSRQYAQDRNKFGGSSAPSEAASEKPQLRYGLKDMPKKDVPAEKPQLRYGLKDMPKDTSSTAAVKDKMVSGLEKAAKKVPAYEAIKGIPTSKVATGLGRAAMLEAGPAIAATVLAESADKYGRERGFGFQTRDVPKSSMSKKSDPIVDAINAEPKAKAATPDVEIKKTEIVKTAPAVSKPALKSGTSKPKGPTEGDRARAAIESMRSQYESGDLYNKVGLEKSAEDENARTKTEATEASEYKKGGMTKRPPKPAKKVPPRKFASGGSTSRTSASKRGDGCATKGHTKGNMR